MGTQTGMMGMLSAGSKALYSGVAAAGKGALNYLKTPGGQKTVLEAGKIGTQILVARKRRHEEKKMIKSQKKVTSKQEKLLAEEKKQAMDKLRYQRMSRNNFGEYL